MEDFYNEKSNFFAQFDRFELKVQTPGGKAKGTILRLTFDVEIMLITVLLGKKKGLMDPLDASLGDIEPDDADLDFLLASYAFL